MPVDCYVTECLCGNKVTLRSNVHEGECDKCGRKWTNEWTTAADEFQFKAILKPDPTISEAQRLK